MDKCEQCARLEARLAELLIENSALVTGYLRMRHEVAAAIRKPPLGGSIGQAFDALRDAAGGAWDGVDAEEYLGEVRGADDEGE